MSSRDKGMKRPRLWRITALILAPIIIIACLEAGRRMGWYGRPVDIAIKETLNGKERYVYNTQLGRCLPSAVKDAEMSPFAFDIAKDPRTYRIFIVGGSAAQGVPDPSYDFGRILEMMLGHQYEGTDFEVINVALAGVDVDDGYKILRSCAGYAPDLIVIHMDSLGAVKEGVLTGLARAGTRTGAQVLLCSLPVSPVKDLDLENVTVVDLKSALAGNPSEMLYDRKHYRLKGSVLVAKTLVAAIKGVLPDSITRHGSGRPAMTLADFETRLIYTDLERYLSAMTVLHLAADGSLIDLTAEDEVGLKSETVVLRKTVDAALRGILQKYKQGTTSYPQDWRLNWKAADYAYRYFRNYRLVQDQAGKVLKILPHAGAHILLLRTASIQGRLDEAEAHARTLIQMRPTRADSYFDLGEIYKKRGEYEEAIQWFAKGIRLQPGKRSVVAYTHMAELYEAVGRPAKAIKVLFEVIEEEPRNHAQKAYVSLGLLLAAEGRDDEAVEVLRKAIEAFPVETLPRREELVRFLRGAGEAGLAARLEEEPRMDTNKH